MSGRSGLSRSVSLSLRRVGATSFNGCARANGWAMSAAILLCPSCAARLEESAHHLVCTRCATSYPIVEGIPILLCDSVLDGEHKARQATFFDEEVDEEFEITRPRGAPAFYEWLLREKVGRTIAGLETALAGGSALVVCAGSGMDAELIAERGADVIAADISVGAVRRIAERARRHSLSIQPLVADVERIPLRDQSVDVSFVHDGLHHLEDPLGALDEMARVARLAVCVCEPADAFATRVAVALGLALEEEEAGNRVERLRTEEVVRHLAARGFGSSHAHRFAMYYRHEPGRVVRALSGPVGLPVAKLGFRAVNAFVGRFGNKLVVQARRLAVEV
jgi:SAM-dependent methyltransferase